MKAKAKATSRCGGGSSSSKSRIREFITVFIVFIVCIHFFWRRRPATTFPKLSTENFAVIPGSYIVVLHSSVTSLDEHFDSILEGVSAVSEHPDEEVAIEGYQMGDFVGYAATLSREALMVVENSPDVKYVEPDRTISLPNPPSRIRIHPRDFQTTTTTPTSSWGLHTLSHLSPTFSSYPSYVHSSTSGFSTTAYILSTGISTSHTLFSGRATLGYNAVPTSSNLDTLGYGTALAGLIAADTLGVAQRANVVGIKVINDEGSGTVSGVISGIVWALAHAQQSQTLGSSALLLGYDVGVPSSALAAVIEAAVGGGMMVLQGSGDASFTSPVSSSPALIIGAAATPTTRASFSNYGTEIDLWAPGSGLLTTHNSGIDATISVSGSSFAAAYATGLALYLMRLEFDDLASPGRVRDRMVELARLRRKGVGKGPAGLLMYNGAA